MIARRFFILPEMRSPEMRSPEMRSPEMRSPEMRSPEKRLEDRKLFPGGNDIIFLLSVHLYYIYFTILN